MIRNEYDSGGGIDGVICEKKECQAKAEDEEMFATWEETKEEGWPPEEGFWGIPYFIGVYDMLNSLRPYQDEKERKKAENQRLAEEQKKQEIVDKNKLDKEKENIFNLLMEFQNIPWDNKDKKTGLALSIVELLIDCEEIYLWKKK